MIKDYVDEHDNVAHLIKVENEIATFIVNDEKERQELAWGEFIGKYKRIGNFIDDESFVMVDK